MEDADLVNGCNGAVRMFDANKVIVFALTSLALYSSHPSYSSFFVLFILINEEAK